MTARVVVVGLGPAGPDLVTAGTLETIARVQRRFVRTVRHPSVGVVTDAESFDHLYDSATSIDAVYRDIVDGLAAAAEESGDVLYAVPGSPAVAERSVELLRQDRRVEVEVHPALSFLDLVWARLGVDPLASGPRLVDGHRFAVDAAGERGPLLVAQCDRREVLSDIKLAVDDPFGLEVTILARLGLPDEEVTVVAWDDLDRVVEPDHLTSLWIPELASPISGEIRRFDELVARLRVECPWDREQTHRSLTPHLLEETHEVLEVLDRFPADAGTYGSTAADDALGDLYDALEEELGDLLFQICFHTRLASEAGRFTLGDVARGIHDKLVSRHPHVFGSVDAGTSDAVVGNWEAIKRAEKGRESVFDGVPASLPALAYTAKVFSRAERAGLGAEVDAALAELGDDDGAERLVGAELVELVRTASSRGVDPEQALRSAVASTVERLRRAEPHAAE